ncbi:hypothetical protein OEZ85_008901 [Tetradesmus obliquus]|uniref:SAM-dependent MTase RsmB/NOP-type domain-containing protein n=1 Tax=Tetradesmus obliquus TaxID=3088 RepID=A0ABY8TK61_TETOB|nr:hypothetical protein OEZ85_008901 [Tetradesmus obliquus]
MPKVKKHKSVLAAKQSITKKPATSTQHNNRKPQQQTQQQQSARPSKQASVRPKAPRAGHAAAWPAGQWRCASVIDQQSAEALLRLLSAAETRTAGATIKSLTLAPHIVHKKPTYAVTVETLKHLPLLKAVLAAAGLLQQHQELLPAAAYVLSYELLFGQGFRSKGPAEVAVLAQKSRLQESLQSLLQHAPRSGSSAGHISKARGQQPSSSKKRSRQQSRDDEQAAAAAGPSSSSSSSPRVFAFDKDPKRLKRLQANVAKTGAGSIVLPRQADFLTLDPTAAEFSEVRGVILDPSCSGSGTVVSRMDHLLPQAELDSAEGPGGSSAADAAEQQRVEQLAKFQEAAVLHALKFPALQRLVYSTCSVHQRENEDVVAAVLPAAAAAGFKLVDPFPAWHRRGLPVVAGAELLVRTDAYQDGTDGFFVAVFERQ